MKKQSITLLGLALCVSLSAINSMALAKGKKPKESKAPLTLTQLLDIPTPITPKNDGLFYLQSTPQDSVHPIVTAGSDSRLIYSGERLIFEGQPLSDPNFFSFDSLYSTKLHSKEQLVGAGASSVVTSISVDNINGYVYWLGGAGETAGLAGPTGRPLYPLASPITTGIHRFKLNATLPLSAALPYKTLISSVPVPEGLAGKTAPINSGDVKLDVVNGKLYWTTTYTVNAETHAKIYRANLDGSNQEVFIDINTLRAADFGTGLGAAKVREFSSADGIALDLVNRQIYWTDAVAGDIHRAPMDSIAGAPVAVQLLSGLSSPSGIAVNTATSQMYWVEGSNGINAKISRSLTDGTLQQTLVTPQTGFLGKPYRIALDVAAGTMYWSDAKNGVVQRANLDGTNINTLAYAYSYHPDGGHAPARDYPVPVLGIGLKLTGDTLPQTQGIPDLGLVFGAPTGKIKKSKMMVKGSVLVTNGGTGSTVKATTLEIFLSDDNILDAGDTLLKTKPVPSNIFNAGRVSPITINFKKTLLATDVGKYIILRMDPENVITELTDSNPSYNVQAQKIRAIF